MRTFFLRLTWFLPILLLVVGLNLVVDPANIRDEGTFEETAASILLSGKNVANLRNCNERLLQKKIIEGLRHEPQVVVVGSSRTMMISSSCFPGRTFLNASISGAGLEDLIGVYGALRQRGYRPEKFIMGLDPTLLAEKKQSLRWNSLSEEYRAMETVMGFESSSLFDPLGPRRRYLEFASPAYFRESVKALVLYGGMDRTLWATENRMETQQVRLADGSLVDAQDVRDRDVAAVKREAVRAVSTEGAMHSLAGSRKLDQNQLEHLDRFIELLSKDGVDVMLYLPPYHPVVWKIIEADPAWAMVPEREVIYRALAARHAVPIVGAYDPAVAHFTEADFKDGLHAKAAPVEQILGCRSADQESR